MVKCGNCKEKHSGVAAVKACYVGLLFTCGWLVERLEGWADPETGEAEFETVMRECGAEAIATDTGWHCAAGHEHTNAEARAAQGWDYAEEYGEAMDLALAGVEPRTMSGHVVTGPADFVRVA